ncbi:MAG: hypothetical protein M1830_006256 [Pleopsidium flavum]|nr:MAG: hypothetical protein M1830_006256 [Pleopsidium flavum]
MSNNLKPLILHAHGTGPNPYKAAILLEALQLPYQIKLWEFGDAPNGVKGPKFLKINENGRVPALEDPNTGVVSWESGAVVNYILRVYDKSSKFGPGDSEQEKVDFDKWVFFLVSSLGPMTGQCNWFRHYHPQKNDDAYKRFQEQAYRTYGILEGQLKKTDGKSVLEKGFTAVDAHFYPWVFQYEYAGLSLDEYPMVKKWLENVGQRSEIKAAYEKVPKGEKA